MTIKSLLLGSAAVLALGTSAQAADPIAVALDTCDLLNITGLTISSESNCLKFEGEVSYEWTVDSNSVTSSTVEWELTTTATADSDFGPAFAVIELTGQNVGTGSSYTMFGDAYVGIGDAASTVIYAGKKGTIGNTDDSETLTAVYTAELDNTTGLNAASSIAGGVMGGHVIQIQSSLGDGVTAGFGLEGLEQTNHAVLVGSVAVSQDWGTAHATFVYDDLISGHTNWLLHTGATFSMDDYKLLVGFSTDELSDWDLIISGEATMDMFTLAAGVLLEPGSEWEATISGVAQIDDNTTFTAAFLTDEASAWKAKLEGETALSDTLTAGAGVEFTSTSTTTFNADLTWAPGGGFEASAGVTANSAGYSKLTTSFEKAFE